MKTGNSKSHEIKFSIPFNGDISLTAWAIKTGKVYEVYFAGAQDNDYSSPYQNLRKDSERKIINLIQLCSQNKINRNLLINKAILYFDDLYKISKYIKTLKKFGGVTSITFADPCIIPFISKVYPEIRLQSSVFTAIDNVYRAREAIKMGILELCLDVSLNRNAPELRKIVALKKTWPSLSIKLLANHGCYLGCIYGVRHAEWPLFFNIKKKMHLSKQKYILGNMLDSKKCVYRPSKTSDEVKRPFIRPEDVSFYEREKLVDYIKIAYRLDNSDTLKKKMLAYFTRSYDGNLFEIIPSNRYGLSKYGCKNKYFPSNFIEKVTNCSMDCSSCNYCEDVAARVIYNQKSRQIVSAYLHKINH